MSATTATPAPDADGVLSEKLAAASLPTDGANGANGAENGDDSGDEGDDGEAAVDEGGAATGGAKKKKKKKSGAAKKKAKAKNSPQAQSEPPRVGLTKIFTNGVFPVGEIQEYTGDNTYRTTSAEMREKERLTQENETDNYNTIRRAAEVHRQVRQYARRTIKPGMSMLDIVNLVEDGTRALVEENGMESGIGFPTGVSLNECAAHYTPNAGDKRILQSTDVLKVDFGVHVKGRIVDSAFTLTFEDTWNPLLEAVRAATNEGVKQAGIDARLGEIGTAIQEVMESHEFDANGKTHKVKCVQNLNGHSISPYVIHGGKSVPIIKTDIQTKMEEGEYFAIETFGTTGKGVVIEQGDCSHYARKPTYQNPSFRVASARPLLHTINKNFGSLPFCRRYLDRAGEKSYLLGLRHLVNEGVVQDYPPLCDIPGSMTAQFEHTILLRPTCKEVVSRGDDY